eukprot:2567444-Ditylum_brightwellii.AAC.1
MYKSREKLITFLICKAAECPCGKEPGRNKVAYEIKHLLKDNCNNEYPPRDKLFMTCSRSGSSNAHLTIEILLKVIFPKIGILQGRRCVVLLDDFKGHNKDIIKEFTQSYRNEEDTCNLCQVQIMGGGITPVSQPIDKFIGKIFKGLYHEHYNVFMLFAPENDKGQPMPTSRQLCAQWVVKAWDAISEESIKKAWVVCGYKSMEELVNIPSSIDGISPVFAKSGLQNAQEHLSDNDEHHCYFNPENSEKVFF